MILTLTARVSSTPSVHLLTLLDHRGLTLAAAMSLGASLALGLTLKRVSH